MRTTLFFSMLLMGLLLVGCNQSEPTGPSIGVVDTARVFRDSEPGKAGVKFLEGLHEKMQAEPNSIQENLQKKPEDEALQQKLQATYMSFQQRMSTEQQNVITLLNDATQRAMDAYRNQKKLDVILGSESALSYAKNVDVTTDIIAELNKQKVDFKPVQAEEAKTAPAPVEAPAAKAAPAQEVFKVDGAKAAPAQETPKADDAKAAPKK